LSGQRFFGVVYWQQRVNSPPLYTLEHP